VLPSPQVGTGLELDEYDAELVMEAITATTTELRIAGETYLLIGCLSPCYRLKTPIFRIFFSGKLEKWQMRLVLDHVIDTLASLGISVILTSSDAAFDYMTRGQTILSLCDEAAADAESLTQTETALCSVAKRRKLTLAAAYATRILDYHSRAAASPWGAGRPAATTYGMKRPAPPPASRPHPRHEPLAAIDAMDIQPPTPAPTIQVVSKASIGKDAYAAAEIEAFSARRGGAFVSSSSHCLMVTAAHHKRRAELAVALDSYHEPSGGAGDGGGEGAGADVEAEDEAVVLDEAALLKLSNPELKSMVEARGKKACRKKADLVA
jgi:hypothetical protein